MKSTRELRAEIEKLQEEFKKADEAERYIESLGLEYQIAMILHDKHCRWNHTDDCGWFYAVKDGKHDWSEYGHQDYLKKAKLLINLFCRHGLDDRDVILDIVKNLPV